MVRLRFGKNRRVARDLETERFELKSLGPIECLRLTAPWRRDPDMLRALFQSAEPRSLLDWIRVGPSPDNLRRFGWAIIPKGTSVPIGIHTVRFDGYRSANCMVGISDRNWWGRDVVIEVRARLINHIFATAEIDRFGGMTASYNAASIFNYRRLGFAHVGTEHRVRRDAVDGKVFDLLSFEMFREQWQKGPFAETTDEHI